MSSGDSSGLIALGDGYIQTLKRRIRHLEDFQRKRPRLDNASNTPNPTSEALTRQTGDQTDDEQTPMSNVSVRDALKDFGHFALNVQDSSKVTHSNAFTMWYFVELAMLSSHRTQLGCSVSLSSSHFNDHPGQSLNLRKEDTASLISQYIDTVLSVYPYISGAELRQYYDTVLDVQTHGTSATAGNLSHCFFIVYMALLTVCSNTSKAPVFDFLASKLWSHASALGKDVTSSHSIPCLISLCLCAIHGQGHQNVPQIIAMAMAKAVASGLHRLRSGSLQRADQAEIDEKRRAFWIIYSLDRLLASTMGLPYGIEDQDISTQMPELPKNCEEARRSGDFYLVQLVEHARLLSIIKRNGHRPRMYFTSLYQSWLDSTPLVNESGNGREHFLRLKCRLAVAIYDAVSNSNTSTSLGSSSLDEEDVEDTLMSCIERLRCLEAQYDSDQVLRCFTDQYEIASIGIMCSTIQHDLSPTWPSSFSNLCSSIKMLSISLLSYLSATYPAATQMRKVLSALDADDDSRLLDVVRQVQWTALVPRPIRKAIARRISTV